MLEANDSKHRYILTAYIKEEEFSPFTAPPNKGTMTRAGISPLPSCTYLIYILSNLQHPVV